MSGPGTSDDERLVEVRNEGLMHRRVIETARFVLREMHDGDLDFVASMLADPAVMRYYPSVRTREEAGVWLERQKERYAVHGHGLWLVADKHTGEPVGQVGLVIQHVDGVDETEVGYLIAQRHWRRGFASEAAAACRDYALGTLGCRRVISLIRPENLPSQGVARKIGMRPEKPTIHAGLQHLVFALARAGPAGES